MENGFLELCMWQQLKKKYVYLDLHKQFYTEQHIFSDSVNQPHW